MTSLQRTKPVKPVRTGIHDAYIGKTIKPPLFIAKPGNAGVSNSSSSTTTTCKIDDDLSKVRNGAVSQLRLRFESCAESLGNSKEKSRSEENLSLQRHRDRRFSRENLISPAEISTLKSSNNYVTTFSPTPATSMMGLSCLGKNSAAQLSAAAAKPMSTSLTAVQKRVMALEQNVLATETLKKAPPLIVPSVLVQNDSNSNVLKPKPEVPKIRHFHEYEIEYEEEMDPVGNDVIGVTESSHYEDVSRPKALSASNPYASGFDIFTSNHQSKAFSSTVTGGAEGLYAVGQYISSSPIYNANTNSSNLIARRREQLQMTDDCEYEDVEVIPRQHRSLTLDFRDKPRFSAYASDSTLSPVGYQSKFLTPREHTIINEKKNILIRQMLSEAFAPYRSLSGLAPNLDDEPSAVDGVSVASDSEDEDARSDSVSSREIERRVLFAQSVRLRTQRTIEHWVKTRGQQQTRLFTCCLVVRLVRLFNSTELQRKIVYLHPSKYKEENFITSMPLFCFPDPESFTTHRPGVDKDIEKMFSFVLTNETGIRNYVYCRRYLVSLNQTMHESRMFDEDVDGQCIAEALCIVSPLEAQRLYMQILEEAQARRQWGVSERGYAQASLDFLEAVYLRPLPAPGDAVELSIGDRRGVAQIKISFMRPLESRIEHVTYSVLLTCLGIQQSLVVFSYLLLESKIIFCSHKLSRLSTCTQALCGLLYPLSWQHVFISVLPASLLDIVCSPTPYVVGIMHKHLVEVEQMPLDDDVVIVNLDTGTVSRRSPPEKRLLPKKLSRCLAKALDASKDIEAQFSGDSRDLLIMEAFLRFFVVSIGHYGDFISTQQNGDKGLLRESFCNAVQSKSLRNMLRWLVETQNFSVFFRDISTESASKRQYDLFERRVLEFRAECEESQQRAAGLGLKEFAAKLKRFFVAKKSTSK